MGTVHNFLGIQDYLLAEEGQTPAEGYSHVQQHIFFYGDFWILGL